MKPHRIALRLSSILMGAAAASLCPAGNLSFLDDTSLASLDDADRKLQLDAARAVLESAVGTASEEWSNPKSGSSGRVESLGNYRSEDGLHCRKVRLQSKAKGVESRFTLPVCKDENGEWLIASGKKLQKQ